MHERSGRRSSAYLYQFSRVPSVRVPGFPRGAFHGLKVACVFGKMGTFDVRDPVDLRLSDEIVRLWTRFAARGDPNGTGEEVWPTYDPGTDRHLELGEALVVETGLYKAACDLAAESGLLRERGVEPSVRRLCVAEGRGARG